MRRIAAAALIAALPTTSPAAAADLPGFTSASPRSDQGVFAGARIRVALGGERGGRASAGVAIAPTRLSRTSDGQVLRHYAEGLEFGIASGDRGPVARLAGYRLRDGAPIDARGRRLQLNTIETAAIIGGAILLAGVVVALAVRSDDGCCE